MGRSLSAYDQILAVMLGAAPYRHRGRENTCHGSPNPYLKTAFRFKASGGLSGAFCFMPLYSINGVYTSGNKAVQARLAGLYDSLFRLDKTRILGASGHLP